MWCVELMSAFTFQVISSNKKEICTLQITDTTGSHQFPAMQRLSISKGHAFILVFSISSRQSLEELKTILELVNEVGLYNIVLWCCFVLLNSTLNAYYHPFWYFIAPQVKGDLTNIPVMLVGNKCDEESGAREVGEKTGQALQVKSRLSLRCSTIENVKLNIN